MVGGTGLEPVTSAMSTQRSNRAELTAQVRGHRNKARSKGSTRRNSGIIGGSCRRQAMAKLATSSNGGEEDQ